MRNVLPLLLGLCPLSGLLFSCAGESVHHNDLVYGYGTFWDIHLYEGSQEDCDEIARFISSSSALFDVTDLGGGDKGLHALNESEDFVELDPMVIEALTLAKQYEKDTGGAFNYHIGTLTDLWLSSLEKGALPEEEERLAAFEEAKATSVEIEGSKAKRVGEGKIDLNALSKGYCCLKIKEKLAAKNITKYLVNGGTSSILIGENSSESGTVKVNLEDAPGRYFHVRNQAVSCSSSSRQAYVIGGVTYSHIVNPFTGLAKANYQAIYLAGEDACLLDAYSTAAMTGDITFASSLEEKGIRSAWVNDGEVVYATDGFLA